MRSLSCLHSIRLGTVAAIVCAAALASLGRINFAVAQGRDWTSRFLPQQRETADDEEDGLDEREQGRYYRNLVGDENEVREAADRLRRLARNARRFSSGTGAAGQQTAFVQLLQEVGAREQVAAVLHETIPALNADNFAAEPFCGLVQPDGSLAEPPLILQQGRARAPYSAVRSVWSDVANSLTTVPPTVPDVNRLSAAFARWKTVHHRGHNDEKMTAGGLEVHAWFARTEDLLRALASAGERARLSAFLLHSGYPFPGGSVGDLVDHVLDYNLCVRLGSPAHVVLVNLTQEMLLEADADLAVLEDRIEFYKQQSLASEGGSGGGGSPFRRGQSESGTPSLPRRDPPGAESEVRPAPTQRVADDPFRRWER